MRVNCRTGARRQQTLDLDGDFSFVVAPMQSSSKLTPLELTEAKTVLQVQQIREHVIGFLLPLPKLEGSGRAYRHRRVYKHRRQTLDLYGEPVGAKADFSANGNGGHQQTAGRSLTYLFLDTKWRKTIQKTHWVRVFLVSAERNRATQYPPCTSVSISPAAKLPRSWPFLFGCQHVYV